MRTKVVVMDGTKRNRKFEGYCVLTQKALKRTLNKELRKNLSRETYKGDGFLYSPGTVPILLVAHLDTVHKETPKTIVYGEGKISSPQGIGGDDRCGVYMVMEILKEIPCHVLFCEDEEKGGEGSSRFTQTKLCRSLVGEFQYVIELDRRGSNDAVYYSLYNKDFSDFVTESGFFKEAYGTFTDICELGPALQVAGVNLSCGYYKQHTLGEYVVLDEMETLIRETKRLIRRTKADEIYELEESTEDTVDPLDSALDYGSGYYTITYVTNNGEKKYFDISAISGAEAFGWFAYMTGCYWSNILSVDYTSYFDDYDFRW